MAATVGLSPARSSSAVIATLWMLGTTTAFILMMISARELTADMSSFQVLSFRSLVGLPVMCVVAWRMGLRNVRTARPTFQVARNVVHFAGQLCWVIGISLLPLAQVTALEFTMPIWTAIIAMMFIGEQAKPHRIIAIAIGFLGTLVILRPGFGIVSNAAFIVLLCAVFYGASNVMVKSLTRDDAPWVIVFWMQVIQLPLALIPAVFVYGWVWPPLSDTPWLLAIGLTGLTAHFCMARAFQHADASVCIPIDFLRLPLAVVAGWLIYSEEVSIWVLAGAAMIFGGNYYSVWRESRSQPA